MKLANLIDCRQAARVLGCTADHVARLCRTGVLRGRQFSWMKIWAIDGRSVRRYRKRMSAGRHGGGEVTK